MIVLDAVSGVGQAVLSGEVGLLLLLLLLLLLRLGTELRRVFSR
jgi:hypothetical protein